MIEVPRPSAVVIHLEPAEASPLTLAAYMADDGTVQPLNLDAGVFELVLLGYGDQARTPLLWHQTVTVTSGASTALGSIDLSGAGRLVLLDCGARIWRITSESGLVSPLTEELLFRSGPNESIEILGLPAGRYFAELALGGSQSTFVRSGVGDQSTALNPSPR